METLPLHYARDILEYLEFHSACKKNKVKGFSANSSIHKTFAAEIGKSSSLSLKINLGKHWIVTVLLDVNLRRADENITK